MDATERETRTIRLAGREMQLYVPTVDQRLAITLCQSDQFTFAEKMEILREVWFDLFTDRADRVYFVTEIARRQLGVKALSEGLAELMQPAPGPVPEPEQA